MHVQSRPIFVRMGFLARTGLGATLQVAGLEPPEQPESLPMPAQDGFGLEDEEGLLQLRTLLTRRMIQRRSDWVKRALLTWRWRMMSCWRRRAFSAMSSALVRVASSAVVRRSEWRQGKVRWRKACSRSWITEWTRRINGLAKDMRIDPLKVCQNLSRESITGPIPVNCRRDEVFGQDNRLPRGKSTSASGDEHLWKRRPGRSSDRIHFESILSGFFTRQVQGCRLQ